MPRSSVKTLNSIQEAGFRLLFKRGYARVSMDDIASAAGVTKRTLYYHFDSKDALIGSTLLRQAELSLQQIKSWNDPDAKTAMSFLDGLMDKQIKWAESPEWTGSGFTRLTLELGDLPGHPVRTAASYHKKAVENWISEELRQRGDQLADRNATAFCLLSEGATVMSMIHLDIGYLIQARETLLSIVAVNAERAHDETYFTRSYKGEEILE